MLIPKQVLGEDKKAPASPRPSNVFNTAFDLAKKVDDASKKLPPRKLKISTAYGEFEVEHTGKASKRVVDNHREIIEEEGRKQGWQRKDGTVADNNLNVPKADPKQYDYVRKAVNQSAKPKKSEPEPRLNRAGQSRVDAFDQSRVDQSAEQEYTGGDVRLSRTAQGGRGMNKTQQRRLTPQEAESVDVSGETKRILQGLEQIVFGNTPGGKIRDGLNSAVQGAVQTNQNAYTPDPTVSMLGGMAQDALFPLSRISSGVGNLYDSSATGEERLGAAGNLLLEGLSVAGSLPGAKSLAKSAGSGLESFMASQAKKSAKKADAKFAAKIGVTEPFAQFGKLDAPKPASFEEFAKAPKVADDVNGIGPESGLDVIAKEAFDVSRVDLEKYVKQHKPGDTVSIVVKDGDTFKKVDVKLLKTDQVGAYEFDYAGGRGGRGIMSAAYVDEQTKRLNATPKVKPQPQPVTPKPTTPEASPSAGGVSAEIEPWQMMRKYKGSDGGQYADYSIGGNRNSGMVTLEMDKKRGYRIRNIYVSNDLQRKGYASAAYDQLNSESISKTGKPLRSSEIGYEKNSGVTTMSPDAQALWESLLSKGKARKVGDYYEFVSDASAISKTQQVPQPETPVIRENRTTEPPTAPVDVPTTSARKAQVADDRTDMGLGELEAPVRKSFGKSLDNARAKGYDGAWASREAESVIAKPRALDDEETAGMVDAMARLKNDHKSLLKQAENATDPAELSRINEGLKGIESQFDSISTAVRKSGTEKGRALASQKITINEDFDLISVRSRARANKGGDLTAKEDAELVKRVNDLEAENVSYSAKIKELTEELTKALSVNTARRRTGGFSKEQTSARRVQAKTRFEEAKKKAGNVIGLNALAGKYLDPDVVKAFKEYVNATIDDGARTLDDVIKKMADEGVEADYEDVYTALTAKTGLRKLSDIQKEIALARKELLAQARAAVEPDVPKAKRQMTREQKVKFREGALRNQIAKIDAQIEQKKLFPKGAKIETPEIKRLEAIRKEKQAKLDEITKPQKEAQKVSDKAAAIQSQIDELKKKAADGSLTAPERKAVDAELLQLRQQRDAARRLAQESSLDYNMGTIQAKLDAKAKAKATRESPEGIARQVKRTKEQLQSDIAELDAKIKAGDYLEAQPKKLREVDAEVYRLRAIRKMKQDRIRAVVESARPLSTAEKAGTVLTELKMLNPFARLTDLAANTSNLASTVIETPARYAVDKLVGAVTKNDPLIRWNYETRDRLARVMDNIKKTRGIELQRVLTGTDKASMEKFGKSRGPGGKLAGATDVPFRVVYREFGQDLFADAKARKLLPNGTKAEIANMRESILRSIDEHPDIIDAAEEYSLYKTFNNDNLVSKSFSMIRNGVIKNEAGKVLFDETIARFSRVITNVGQDAFDRTPYGLVANAMKLAVKRGSLTDVQRLVITDRLAKGLYGSAFMALGYYLGDQINVEFKGDKNKYADFGDLEKLGGLPGVFLYGVASRQSEKLKPDQTEMFKRQQATNLLTNSPAASNVQDMLGSLMQPGTNKVEQFAAKKITNMVIPSFFRDVASRMDSPTYGLTEGATRREKVPQEYNESTERMRQTRNFWLILMKEAQSKVPVLRQQLPEKK